MSPLVHGGPLRMRARVLHRVHADSQARYVVPFQHALAVMSGLAWALMTLPLALILSTVSAVAFSIGLVAALGGPFLLAAWLLLRNAWFWLRGGTSVRADALGIRLGARKLPWSKVHGIDDAALVMGSDDKPVIRHGVVLRIKNECIAIQVPIADAERLRDHLRALRSSVTGDRSEVPEPLTALTERQEEPPPPPKERERA